MVEGGSILHADHPRKWVIFARRFTEWEEEEYRKRQRRFAGRIWRSQSTLYHNLRFLPSSSHSLCHNDSVEATSGRRWGSDQSRPSGPSKNATASGGPIFAEPRA